MNVRDMKITLEDCGDFNEIVAMIRKAGAIHKSYSHYTSLASLLPLIRNRQWWLTRATSPQFDDLIESRKYGNKKELKNLYFASFSYQQAESAAMWRLYSDCDEYAVRVTLNKNAISSWLRALNRQGSCACAHPVKDGQVNQNCCIPIQDAYVCDVLYASVSEEEDSTQSRAKSLCWNDRFSKAIEDLVHKKKTSAANGILKDYEWRFEYESRLVVKIAVDANEDCDRIAVDIPDDVLAKMKFTRSPWIRFEDRICQALRSAIVKKPTISESVKQSVLSGALEKWRKRETRCCRGRDFPKEVIA